MVPAAVTGVDDRNADRMAERFEIRIFVMADDNRIDADRLKRPYGIVQRLPFCTLERSGSNGMT